MTAEKIQARIEEIYRNNRSENKHIQNMRREEVGEKNPEIINIFNELTMSGIDTAKLVMNSRKKGVERKSFIVESIKEMKERNTLLKDKIDSELEKLGYEKNYLDDLYSCGKCKDRGFTDKGKCECYYEIYKKVAYEFSYLDDVKKEECFEKFNIKLYRDDNAKGSKPCDREIMKMIYNSCKNYAEKFDKMRMGIMLMGKSGIGKSFLCNCIAQKVAKDGHVVVYVSAKKFFDSLIRADFFSGSQNRDVSFEEELSEKIYDCDLLIIDDLGTENTNNVVAAEFFNVLNGRRLQNKKTIISTNLVGAEIGRIYSERIYSRISEDFAPMKCVGDDIRQMAKA